MFDPQFGRLKEKPKTVDEVKNWGPDRGPTGHEFRD
jgi:hypothetical protein